MLSLQAIVVFSGYSAASSLLMPTDNNKVDLFENAEYRQQHWTIVKPLLDDSFPGITCTINVDNKPTEEKPVSNVITSSIESNLNHIHPSIRCIGNIIERDVSNFINIRDNMNSLERRDNRKCPDSKYPPATTVAKHGRKLSNQDVNTEGKAQNEAGHVKAESGYRSCSYAPHPDACQACWAGFTTQLASDIGDCNLKVYKASISETDGTWSDTALIWIGYLCCLGSCIGKFVALSSGCGSR